MGITIPVTNDEASSSISQSIVPRSSSGLPKRPIGVPAKIFAVRFEKGCGRGAPGTVQSDDRSYLAVTCADGRLMIDEIQIAGKRRMPIRELLPGLHGAEDYFFGPEPDTPSA